MIAKSKKILIGITVGLVVTSSTILGIILPGIVERQIPADSQLVIFTEDQNIAILNITSYKELTNGKFKMALSSVLNYYNINSYLLLKIISTKDNGDYISSCEVNSLDLELGKNGFEIDLGHKKIDSIQGLAINVYYNSVDIAPTIYNALSLKNWYTQGQAFFTPEEHSINKTIIILLDSFGWGFWDNLSNLGLIELEINPFIEQPALTVFPSITNVATASILTGYWPEVTGIMTRQNHQLEVPSIFDIAGENNLTTEYIEGNVGFLNLEADYEFWLTDQNENDNIDDEIFDEAYESINDNRSDLLFVHFHGIDDIGHTYGPYSSEWMNKVNTTFSYVNDLIKIISNDTLVIITADHGMHLAFENDERVGIHGESRFEDMIIPLIFIKK
ncbi:MAG TPA: alkaline phosphatase family protein [Candidatus Bathyarchaeia archaeon]|nr:alkaline phosphatase family protein [Candidatus Bathyarchaeia archaeon]